MGCFWFSVSGYRLNSTTATTAAMTTTATSSSSTTTYMNNYNQYNQMISPPPSDDDHSRYEHIVARLVEISVDAAGKTVAIGTGTASSSSTAAGCLKHRYVRRRVGPAERDFIWASTNGHCYLCKKYLPRLSPWHVEHVVAFAKEPQKNDVLGNMLASCEKCNLTKSTRSLRFCIDELNFDVATFALEAGHLNTAARTELLNALDYKHQRSPMIVHGGRSISDAELNDIMTEIELKVSIDCRLLQLSTSSTVFHFSEAASLRQLDRSAVDFDEENAACVSFGSYGRVFQGTFRYQKAVDGGGDKGSGNSSTAVNYNVVCAIKIPTFTRKNSLESFRREVEAFSQCQHPNIVSFYGWIAIDPSCSKIGIVMEYCTYDLGDVRALKSIDPLSIFAQVADALQFMHERSMVHRDVKLNNILIRRHRDEPWTHAVAKLCDMGSAKTLLPEDAAVKHTNTGTAGHKPPEIRRGVVDFRSDVYSLGKTMKFLSDANTKLQSDRYCYAAFCVLIQKMINEDFHLRPHAYMVANELRGMESINSTGSSTPTRADSPRGAAKINTTSQGTARSPKAMKVAASNILNKGDHLHSINHEHKDQDSVAVDALCEQLVANKINTAGDQRQHLTNASPLNVQERAGTSACFISLKAGCRENPGGSCRMAYHAKQGCHRSEVEITIAEAEDYKHKPCSHCYR